jgi:hypothetical protein
MTEGWESPFFIKEPRLGLTAKHRHRQYASLPVYVFAREPKRSIEKDEHPCYQQPETIQYYILRIRIISQSISGWYFT